jgi:tetratricopeptide (TPR) repeat protein
MKHWTILSLFGLVAGVVLVLGASRSAAGDEIEAALGVEKLTEGRDGALPARDPLAMTKDRTFGSSRGGGRRSEIAELVDALQQKQLELHRAKRENARLRDMIKRIAEANRKERLAMHYNMGCVYRAGRRYEKAEEEFRKALALDESDADIHYNLGVLYDDDLNKPEMARKHYNRFLELEPKGQDAARVREWLSSMP